MSMLAILTVPGGPIAAEFRSSGPTPGGTLIP